MDETNINVGRRNLIDEITVDKISKRKQYEKSSIYESLRKYILLKFKIDNNNALIDEVKSKIDQNYTIANTIWQQNENTMLTDPSITQTQYVDNINRILDLNKEIDDINKNITQLSNDNSPQKTIKNLENRINKYKKENEQYKKEFIENTLEYKENSRLQEKLEELKILPEERVEYEALKIFFEGVIEFNEEDLKECKDLLFPCFMQYYRQAKAFIQKEESKYDILISNYMKLVDRSSYNYDDPRFIQYLKYIKKKLMRANKNIGSIIRYLPPKLPLTPQQIEEQNRLEIDQTNKEIEDIKGKIKELEEKAKNSPVKKRNELENEMKKLNDKLKELEDKINKLKPTVTINNKPDNTVQQQSNKPQPVPNKPQQKPQVKPVVAPPNSTDLSQLNIPPNVPSDLSNNLKGFVETEAESEIRRILQRLVEEEAERTIREKLNTTDLNDVEKEAESQVKNLLLQQLVQEKAQEVIREKINSVSSFSNTPDLDSNIKGIVEDNAAKEIEKLLQNNLKYVVEEIAEEQIRKTLQDNIQDTNTPLTTENIQDELKEKVQEEAVKTIDSMMDQMKNIIDSSNDNFEELKKEVERVAADTISQIKSKIQDNAEEIDYSERKGNDDAKIKQIVEQEAVKALQKILEEQLTKQPEKAVTKESASDSNKSSSPIANRTRSKTANIADNYSNDQNKINDEKAKNTAKQAAELSSTNLVTTKEENPAGRTAQQQAAQQQAAERSSSLPKSSKEGVVPAQLKKEKNAAAETAIAIQPEGYKIVPEINNNNQLVQLIDKIDKSTDDNEQNIVNAIKEIFSESNTSFDQFNQIKKYFDREDENIKNFKNKYNINFDRGYKIEDNEIIGGNDEDEDEEKNKEESNKNLLMKKEEYETILNDFLESKYAYQDKFQELHELYQSYIASINDNNSLKDNEEDSSYNKEKLEKILSESEKIKSNLKDNESKIESLNTVKKEFDQINDEFLKDIRKKSKSFTSKISKKDISNFEKNATDIKNKLNQIHNTNITDIKRKITDALDKIRSLIERTQKYREHIRYNDNYDNDDNDDNYNEKIKQAEKEIKYLQEQIEKIRDNPNNINNIPQKREYERDIEKLENKIKDYKRQLKSTRNSYKDDFERKLNETIYALNDLKEQKEMFINKVTDLNKINDQIKNIFDRYVKDFDNKVKPSILRVINNRNGNVSKYENIWNKYVEGVNDDSRLLEDVQDKFVNQIQSNDLDPTQVLKLTRDDVILYIIIAFVIRQITLAIVETLIDKSIVNNLFYSLISYLAIYSVIITILVIVTNFDDYKLRIIFNYLNMHINKYGIIRHIMLLVGCTGLIYLLVYYMNPDIHKLDKKQLTEVEKLNLIYKLELITIAVFAFIAITELITISM